MGTMPLLKDQSASHLLFPRVKTGIELLLPQNKTNPENISVPGVEEVTHPANVFLLLGCI